jgi:hypothetical protein
MFSRYPQTVRLLITSKSQPYDTYNQCRSLVGNYMTILPRSVKKAIGFLGPIIEERLAMINQSVDWKSMPVSLLVFLLFRRVALAEMSNQNDLITWLLEMAQEHQRTVKDLTLRILSINFAAIHTSTMVGLPKPLHSSLQKLNSFIDFHACSIRSCISSRVCRQTASRS